MACAQYCAADYTGPAFSKIILQFTPNNTGDRDLQFDPVFRIGNATFTAADASFNYVRGFDGVVDNGGIYNNPDSQYNGFFLGLSLVTYEWDLTTLGYTGSYDTFNFDLHFPQAHTSMYELQIAVPPVPEPSTYAMLLGSATVLCCIGLRKRQRIAI